MRVILTVVSLCFAVSVLPNPLGAPLFKGYREKRAAEGHADQTTASGRTLLENLPFDPRADEAFYTEHAQKVMPPQPTDEQLRRDPDIHHYPFNLQVSEAEEAILHAKFTKKRVRAKRYPVHQGGTEQHPDITELAVVFIQNQKDFVEDFVHFLKALCRG